MTVGTAVVNRFADYNSTVEIRARRQNNCLRPKNFARLGRHADDAIVFDQNFFDELLFDVKVVGILDDLFHRRLINFLVGLSAKGADGKPLAHVERPKLNAGLIGGNAHLSSERVDFADEMSLGGTSD